MAGQYWCQDPRRRVDVSKSATLNGIDYLEVTDTPQPAPQLPTPQGRLIVHCFKSVASGSLTAENVRIEGGERITGITANHVGFGTGTDANQIIVDVSEPGDYSSYTLRLVANQQSMDPPGGFDQVLSDIFFSFKVDCPSDFDCKPSTDCPTDMPAEPTIDYLARDYASFRRLMLDRLALVMPGWTERGVADVGVALLETLAYAADHLSYFQDAVATEAYLGTARRRTSIRRHARLLNYRMHDGCNARAWVAVEVEPKGPADGYLLGAGSPVATQVTSGPTLDPQALIEALAVGGEVFRTMFDIALRSALNRLHFYTWGDFQCCLPRGATHATFYDYKRQVSANMTVGSVLLFEERIGPASGLAADADPAHRHPVRLTRATPRHDDLENADVVDVEWDTEDALPFPLCLSAVVTDPEGVRQLTDVSIAWGNVVLVDHGLLIGGEPLEPAVVPDLLPYRPSLAQTGVTFAVPYNDAIARTQPARATMTLDPRRALAQVELAGDGDAPWRARPDLLNSARFATDLVVETESDGSSRLRFGDDLMGKRPSSGATLSATYRIGNGSVGNVGATAIGHLITSQKGFRTVRNPMPAQGGVDPEPIEQVRLYAPQAFRVQERAVSEADYVEVAQRHPDVLKAAATLRWTGSWHTMFVYVDRRGGRSVDRAFQQEMAAWLERFRLAGYDVEIEGPKFVALGLAMTVCVAPGYFQADVKAALLDVLSSRNQPDGRRGFFHPDNFTFGQPVYLSAVVAAVMSVPGVLWVDTDDLPPKPNRFGRFGQPAPTDAAAGRISFGPLEIARLDNDPSEPEHGTIDFFMQGGL
jgi:hypothetical protein